MNVNTLETYNSETNAFVSTEEVVDSSNLFVGNKIYQFLQNADGSYVTTKEEQANFLDSTGEYVLLRTGTGIYFVGLATWPEEGYEEDGVYYKVTQTLTIPFEQYNE